VEIEREQNDLPRDDGNHDAGRASGRILGRLESGRKRRE